MNKIVVERVEITEIPSWIVGLVVLGLLAGAVRTLALVPSAQLVAQARPANAPAAPIPALPNRGLIR